jgi:hypothetical protein
VENRFTDAEPVESEMVDEKIRRQISKVSGTYDAMIQRTQGLIDNGEITRDVGRLEQMKLDNSRLAEILRIENSEHNLRDKFMSATKDWRNQKEQHVKTVGKCMGVFNTTLGDSAKSAIKDLLSVHKFRAAWIALDHHYHLGVGGQQNVAEVVHALTNMVYDPFYPLIPHIQHMTDMVAEMNTVTKSTENSSLVLEWILQSIEKSTCKDYEKDIDDIRRSDKTLEQSILLFQKTESRLNVHRHQQSRKIQNTGVNYGVEQKDSRVDSVNVTVQQKKTCFLCKKPGHLQKDCWKGMTCGHCLWKDGSSY